MFNFSSKFSVLALVASLTVLLSACDNQRISQLEEGVASEGDVKMKWHYDWRYMDGPNATDTKIFTVVFNSDLKVISTGSVVDGAAIKAATQP